MKTVWLTLTSTLWLTSALTYCPDRCDCKWKSNISLVINCSHQQLTDVPTGIDPQVTCLDLSENDIKSYIVARDFPSLCKLNISHNKLSDFQFLRDIPTLLSLDLSYNSFSDLRDLTIDKQSNLKTVDISHNSKLNKIPRLRSSSVENLNLSYSFINYIEKDALVNLTNLRTLDLSHNLLINIIGLRSDSLQELDLSSGNLKLLTASHLEAFPNLKKLNVSRNSKIEVKTDLFSDNENQTCFSILQLDFTYLELKTMNLTGFCYLENAYLAHNHLANLEHDFFARNSELVHVDLSHNDIDLIRSRVFSPSKKIRYLNLSHNRIQNLTFSKYLTYVEWIDLSCNKVKGLEQLYLKNARDVNVSKNVIYKVGVDLDETLPQVLSLDLSFNNLEILTALKSRSLRNLDLSNCHIISIDLAAFTDLRALETINLAGNKLTRLDYRILAHHTHLRAVRLGHNPWDCDCTSKDFNNLFTFLITNNSLETLDELHCTGSPQEYALTWQQVCEQKWKEDELWLTSKKTFYSLLATFIVVLVIIGLVAWCRYYKGQKTNTTTAETEQESPQEDDGLRVSWEPPRRASTPPPHYEAALLLPRLTEEQKQIAMSQSGLDDVS